MLVTVDKLSGQSVTLQKDIPRLHIYYDGTIELMMKMSHLNMIYLLYI